jgi:hypothetical protein
MPTDTKKVTNRLTNYMEELTGTILEDLLGEYRPTRFSETAIRDIKALALNRLWPMYTTSDSGKDFIRKVVVEDQVEKDVIRELRAAIDIVKSHPRR